jgi:hypothetical protein
VPCTLHRAFLYDRGGEHRISEIYPLQRVRWERVRDDVSTANVYSPLPDPRCIPAISQAEPGRHEIVIFRDNARVWEGPVTLTTEAGRAVTYDARDVGHYCGRTIMRSAYSNKYPKVAQATERLEFIIRHELARKEALSPSINVLAHLDVRTLPGSAKTSRVTKKYQHYVLDEMEHLAWKGGIDYTVVGRRIIINDVDDNIGEGPMITEADFLGEVAITTYGMELATYSAVSDGQGHWAAFGGTDPYYGQIELLHATFDEEKDSEAATTMSVKEMTKQAERNMKGRYPAPVVLRVPQNSTLDPTAASALMDYLIPGVRFVVRATNTYRQLEQVQKLDRVVFEETEAGERINVTLSPAPGQTPWDDGGETGAP